MTGQSKFKALQWRAFLWNLDGAYPCALICLVNFRLTHCVKEEVFR